MISYTNHKIDTFHVHIKIIIKNQTMLTTHKNTVERKYPMSQALKFLARILLHS